MHNLRSDQLSDLGRESADCYRQLKEGVTRVGGPSERLPQSGGKTMYRRLTPLISYGVPQHGEAGMIQPIQGKKYFVDPVNGGPDAIEW